MIQRKFYQVLGILSVGLVIFLLMIYGRKDFFSREKSISIKEEQEFVEDSNLSEKGESKWEESSGVLEDLNLMKQEELKSIESSEIFQREEEKESIINEKESDIEKELTIKYRKNEIENHFIRGKSYRNEEGENFIVINFPQFSGLYKKEKETRINTILEKDTKKLIDNKLYEEKDLRLQLKFYDIKFINEKIVSIFYWGKIGGNSTRHPSDIVMATTIDIENEKILTLSDIVADFDTLKKLLVEDRFECMTLWEGIAYQFSCFWTDPENVGCLSENKIHGEYDSGSSIHTDWYIEGADFYIVLSINRNFYEYRIDLKEVKEVLSEEFLNLLE